jgi:receptor protein-tyrosine kinase
MNARPHLAERAVWALRDQARLTEAGTPRPALPAGPRPVMPERSNAPPVSLAILERAGLAERPSGGGRSRIAEELALVRQQVLRGVPVLPAEDPRCAQVVLVTSARPGEGKSFISLNLAASIADGASTRVLLVDVDGRRGGLGDALGLKDEPGLRALAAAPMLHPATMMRTTEIANLSVMTGNGPGGDTPPGEAIADAVRRIAAEVPDHLIVLDMPPALATSDAGVLAPLAGQVVMVVLAQRTQRSEVEAALDVLDACPEIRLLLNRAGLTLNDSFGAQRGYGGYGSSNHT